MPDLPLIFAKELNGLGGATTYDSVESIKQTQQPLWLHFNANCPETFNLIRSTFPNIDEHSLQVMFDQDARPRTLVLESGTLIILRGINHNQGGIPEDMMAIRLWVTPTRVISLRYRDSKAVMQITDSLDQNCGPKNIGDILTSICSTLFVYIQECVDQQEDKIDYLESRVLDEPNRQLHNDVSSVQKSTILLRRYVAPQQETINQLHRSGLSWLNKKHLRKIQELHNTLLRSIEELDSVKERSKVVKDELINALSDKLNRNLYVLSVITAIFLPLGFLTGLFGINIGGMPGIENSMAFSYFLAGLITVVVIQVILFKLFKWF